MEYSTYWSVLDTPSESIKSNSVCLYVAIGACVCWLLIKTFKKNKADSDKGILLWGSAIFAILGLTGYVSLSFFNLDTSNEPALKLLRSPDTPRVEGIVSDFERTFRSAKGGHETIESFTVDSVRFTYSDAMMSRFGSFTATENSFIFDGQKVRITYTNDWHYRDGHKILKIEVAK